jgi:hypothetical protein
MRPEQSGIERSNGLSPVPGTDLTHAVQLAGPGFLGFEGGLMNPGAIPIDDGILLLGKANDCHWRNAGGANSHLYMTGAPIMLMLDRTFQLRSAERVQIGPDFPTEKRAFEDFRMYRRDGRLWVHGVMAEIETLPDKVTHWRTLQWHAELDSHRRVLTGFTYPELDFPLAEAEKNWCYFVHQGDLYLLYSFSPFVLLKSIGGLRFETVIRRDLHPSLKGLGGFDGRISLGTNPMPYGEDQLLVMIHKFQLVDEERLYFHWAVLLDRETLLPRKISAVPLFTGGEARGCLPGIVYVMAAFQVDDELFFSLCESDSHASFLRLPKKDLDGWWTRFPE